MKEIERSEASLQVNLAEIERSEASLQLNIPKKDRSFSQKVSQLSLGKELSFQFGKREKCLARFC